MSNLLLDCTLRDGGYINNWDFGENAILDIINKLENSNVDIIEIGFLKKKNISLIELFIIRCSKLVSR